MSRSGTYTHRSQKGNVEWTVDPPVEVSTGRRNATLPLKHPQMVGCYAELSSDFRYVHYAVHLNLGDSKP